MSVKPIPEGYGDVTPYLMIQGAAKALEFYKKVFGATERMRIPGPEGMIMHAEILIGHSVIMLADGCPRPDEHKGKIGKSPQAFGGTPVSLHLYVKDADAVFKKALECGGKEVRPLANQFYGDRSGLLEDPFGHMWNIATHVEEVSEEEMKKRMAEMARKG
jgi:PhnB protein